MPTALWDAHGIPHADDPDLVLIRRWATHTRRPQARAYCSRISSHDPRRYPVDHWPAEGKTKGHHALAVHTNKKQHIVTLTPGKFLIFRLVPLPCTTKKPRPLYLKFIDTFQRKMIKSPHDISPTLQNNAHITLNVQIHSKSVSS